MSLDVQLIDQQMMGSMLTTDVCLQQNPQLKQIVILSGVDALHSVPTVHHCS